LLALTLAVSRNRAYQVDEVENIHVAYNLSSGKTLYVDFYQVHNPLLYYLLEPLIDKEDPVASFQRARRLSLSFFLVTISLCAICGHVVAGREGLFLAPVLALSHTTLVERGMEVRPDGPAACLAMLALAVELRSSAPPLRRSLIAALVLGTAFLLTQKAIFPSFAIGVLWLAGAVRERRSVLVLLPVAAWLLPALCAGVAMAMHGNLEEYVQQNVLHAFDAAMRADHRTTFDPFEFILHESRRNLAFVAAALVGIVLGVASARGREGSQAKVKVAVVGLALIASLWATPFPWPYVHVGVLPVLAVCATILPGALGDRLAGPRRPIAVPLIVMLVATLALTTSLPRIVAKSAPTNGYQHSMLEEIQRVTEADDSVFDLVGLYFRNDAYPAFALSGDLFRWYQLGGLPPIVPHLIRNRTAAFIANYRVAWLAGADREFLQRHFVHYSGNIFLQGRNLTDAEPGQALEFRVLKGRDFEYQGAGTLRVNGLVFKAGYLAEGPHTLSLDKPPGPARLIMKVPEPPAEVTPPQSLYVNFD